MTAKTKAFVVTIGEQHLDELPKVADKCRSVGLKVLDTLDFLGQITGEIDPEKRDLLRKIPGVVSVEESREYQLPPPESDIQ